MHSDVLDADGLGVEIEEDLAECVDGVLEDVCFLAVAPPDGECEEEEEPVV